MTRKRHKSKKPPPSPKGPAARAVTPRCTAVEAIERERVIAGWIADGWSPRDIVEKAAAAWGIAETQTRNYYSRVIAAMRADADRERAELVAEGVARREALYRKCVAAGDLPTARAVLTDLARLQALYATDRASLARAGLDKQLAAATIRAGAAEVRELLVSAYDSRVDRGLPPPDLGAPLAAVDEGAGDDPGEVYGDEPEGDDGRA